MKTITKEITSETSASVLVEYRPIDEVGTLCEILISSETDVYQTVQKKITFLENNAQAVLSKEASCYDVNSEVERLMDEWEGWQEYADKSDIFYNEYYDFAKIEITDACKKIKAALLELERDFVKNIGTRIITA